MVEVLQRKTNVDDDFSLCFDHFVIFDQPRNEAASVKELRGRSPASYTYIDFGQYGQHPFVPLDVFIECVIIQFGDLGERVVLVVLRDMPSDVIETESTVTVDEVLDGLQLRSSRLDMFAAVRGAIENGGGVPLVGQCSFSQCRVQALALAESVLAIVKCLGASI